MTNQLWGETVGAGAVFSFPHLDRQTFNGLPSLLAHSLPDDFGNRVIEVWLAAQGRARNSFNPVERLCYIGVRGMGALEYVPSIAPGSLHKSTSVEVEKLLDLARSVLEDRSRLDVHLGGADDRKAEAMLDILRVGVSAGGAVPKAVIAINEDNHIISGQGEIPEGYEHYIIKFDGVSQSSGIRPGRSRDNCRVDYAYSLMARAAGIKMMECRLLEENGRAHFITRRFDRAHNHKIHNGKQDNLSRQDFRQVAYNMEIRKADRIIGEVRDAVAGWPEFAREAGVSPEVIDHIGRYHFMLHKGFYSSQHTR